MLNFFLNFLNCFKKKNAGSADENDTFERADAVLALSGAVLALSGGLGMRRAKELLATELTLAMSRADPVRPLIPALPKRAQESVRGREVHVAPSALSLTLAPSTSPSLDPLSFLSAFQTGKYL